MERKPIVTPEQQAIRKMSLEEKEAFIRSSDSEYLIAYAKLATIPTYVNARQTDRIKPYLDDVQVFAKKTGDHEMLANCYRLFGWYHAILNQYGQALEMLELALEHARFLSDFRLQIPVVAAYGSLYFHMGLNDKALKYFMEEYELAKQFEEGSGQLEHSTAAKHVGSVLIPLKRYDEAIEFLKEGLAQALPQQPLARYYAALPLGEIFLLQGDQDKAMDYFEQGKIDAEKSGAAYPLQRVDFFMGKILYLQGNATEALPIFLKAYEYFSDEQHLTDLKEVALLLSEIYADQEDHPQAYKYLKEANQLEEKLGDDEARKKGYAFDAQIDMERKEKEFEVRLANARLNTLTKIASDIAHEVQNPLQFVNNFSAMNVELVDELNDYVSDGDMDGIKEVVEDLASNSTKIQEHGKRISTIVDHLLDQTRKAQAGELEVDDENKHDFSK